jgi:hypothetical protein
MKVSQNEAEGTISLSQTQYIDKILERVGLKDANPVSTPIDINVKLDEISASDNDEIGADNEVYDLCNGYRSADVRCNRI